MTNVSIKIESPWLNTDIVMEEGKALKYLKTLYKNHAKKGELKVTTKVVDNEDSSK